MVKKCQKEAEEAAKEHYQEREALIFDRWEQERVGLMEEIKEIENNYAHVDVVIAKEKFKTFAFRWMILSKVHKMKKLDRDSYEFTKANLEV